MEHVEYIQDISFNETCDKMAISTTSQKIIIYKKVFIESNELILPEIDKKEEEPPPKIIIKKNPPKASLSPKINMIKNNPSTKSLISVESSDSKKNLPKDEEDDNSNVFFLSSSNKNNGLFKSISFGTKNNYRLDRINLNNENDDLNDDSFDSSLYSPNNLRYSENKRYNYRWEKLISWNTDGPALRLQWASFEFGNILACCGYNKWIYIFGEESSDEKPSWKYIQIKNFLNSVEDISFIPHSLGLTAITSDGYLKIFSKTKNEFKWESKYEFYISKWGCTCLCCNPSNLDELTIVIGCKKKTLIFDNKNDKNILNRTNSDDKKPPREKRSDSIIKNINNDLIKIIYYKNINNTVIGSIDECGHEDDITDVDWANQNGRKHHMICSTSKDGKFIIWEINFPEEIEIRNINKNSNSFFTYKNIFEYKHNKPLWRCSFNDSGVLVNCIDENGECFIFMKTGRSTFVKLDLHKKK